MNSSFLIVALFTAAVLLGSVRFRLFCGAGKTTAGAGLGRGRKLPNSWRRWLFGEHNIPFN
jgi:hypothetical protein